MKIGLNVGSGQRRFTSTPEVKWINVDKVARPGHEPDLLCDGAQLGEMFPNKSIDYFVLVQVLEHFGCGEGAGLIKAAHQVLKSGGSLILSVPDLHELCHEWLHGTKLDTQLFVTNLYGAYMGDEEDRHRWGFTEASLHKFLQSSAQWNSIHLAHATTSPEVPCLMTGGFWKRSA